MSESSLSIGLPELQATVGFFLGYGRTSGNWSAAQLAEIMLVVQSGVRRVYYPPAVDASTVGYEWSWLRPTTTIDTVDEQGDYDLPDDFGRLISGFHFAEDTYRSSIPIVSIGALLERRSRGVISGTPKFAAVRYKASDGSGGQRQEVLLWPEPNEVWTLSYEYEAYSNSLSDSYPYPLGGMQLAELYMESCLSVAESRINDEPGQHTQQFGVLLIDAIARDRKRGARLFGQMGHVEGHVERRRHGDTGSSYDILYKDVVY